jgi:glycosyltransferase involved in cell wall biosynthesis
VHGSHLHSLLHRCVPGGPARAVATALAYGFYDLLRLYGNVATYVCATEAMRALALRAGLPSERLVVAPYGFPRSAFAAPPPREPGRHFLFVGRLEREKGVHLLLEAMRRLPADARLVVAGAGPEEGPLRRQAAGLGLSNVEFAGWATGAALDALYRDAIATVLPCDWFEAFGLVLAESFLRARPVIASRTGGIPEVVDDGVDGLLVPPGDPGALAAALGRLHADRPLAAELGQRGRAKAERRYHATVRADALARIHGAAIAGTPPGAPA